MQIAYKNSNYRGGTSYQALKTAALAWLRYIVQKGYQVRSADAYLLCT
jgi:hypothetical protein